MLNNFHITLKKSVQDPKLRVFHMYHLIFLRPITKKKIQKLRVVELILIKSDDWNQNIWPLNSHRKNDPTFLSMSYLISTSWDGLNSLVYILDTKRCYASVIIPRLEIGRAKVYYYFSFNDGAKIPSIKFFKNKDGFINTICENITVTLPVSERRSIVPVPVHCSSVILYLECFVILACFLDQNMQVPLCLKDFFSLIAFVGSIFIFSLKINSWDHPKGQAMHTTLVMYLCKALN